MDTKNFSNTKLFSTFMVIMVLGIFLIQYPATVNAYWQPLPPYNTLWPLWSPVLSPIDPLTGAPLPIINELTPETILPVQPALTWDPRQANPWLLYNSPYGLCYYDPLYGIDLWPPDSLLDPLTGLIAPIDLLLLKTYYTALAPTSTSWLTNTVPLANVFFYNTYPSITVASTPSFSSFLTPAQLLGL